MMSTSKLIGVRIDTDLPPADPLLSAEQRAAIAALVEENVFELVARQSGPYRLQLAAEGTRLGFHVSDANEHPIVSHLISIRPLLRALRDYRMICHAHANAAAKADPYRLEAIDMARRAVHNDGSELLMARLAGKIRLDLPTARRIFTLVGVSWGTDLAVLTDLHADPRASATA